MKIILKNTSMTFQTFSNDPVLQLEENSYWDNRGQVVSPPSSETYSYMKFGADSHVFNLSDFSSGDKIVSSLSGLQIKFAFWNGSTFVKRSDNYTAIGEGISIISAVTTECPTATRFSLYVSKTSGTISQAELNNVSFQIAQ